MAKIKTNRERFPVTTKKLKWMPKEVISTLRSRHKREPVDIGLSRQAYSHFTGYENFTLHALLITCQRWDIDVGQFLRAMRTGRLAKRIKPYKKPKKVLKTVELSLLTFTEDFGWITLEESLTGVLPALRSAAKWHVIGRPVSRKKAKLAAKKADEIEAKISVVDDFLAEHADANIVDWQPVGTDDTDKYLEVYNNLVEGIYGEIRKIEGGFEVEISAHEHKLGSSTLFVFEKVSEA